ncbi:hypothetical protein KAI37_02542 [Paenibacillus sp. S25]|nr:hypothetical protein KAI37_02542 [Paenibacillus sp. S25]
MLTNLCFFTLRLVSGVDGFDQNKIEAMKYV